MTITGALQYSTDPQNVADRARRPNFDILKSKWQSENFDQIMDEDQAIKELECWNRA